MTFETWFNLDDDCRYWYGIGEESPEELYRGVLEKYGLSVDKTVYVVLDNEMIRVKVIE